MIYNKTLFCSNLGRHCSLFSWGSSAPSAYRGGWKGEYSLVEQQPEESAGERKQLQFELDFLKLTTHYAIKMAVTMRHYVTMSLLHYATIMPL
eukprot:gene21389-biopygen7332